MMYFAAPHSPMPHHVGTIFFWRCPSQVVRNIALFVTVVMRDLMLLGGSRPMPCAANEKVDFPRKNNTAFRKFKLKISIGVWIRCNEATGGIYHTRRTAEPMRYNAICGAPHTSEVADLVVREIGDESPFFGYKIVSHLARLTVRDCQGRASGYSLRSPRNYSIGIAS